MEAADDIVAHYAAGRERERLTARPSLELVRTQVFLQRYLPPSPSRVLDVGGASGVYAAWQGQPRLHVHLIDLVPLHHQQATQHGGFTAALGGTAEQHQPGAD